MQSAGGGFRATPPLRVWYHNAEDDMPEQRRRMAGAMSHHGVGGPDLGRRFFLTSGLESPIKLTQQGWAGLSSTAMRWNG